MSPITWFKVDDGFSQHPKVLRIPRSQRTACAGLWVLAGSWCAKNLTDGHLDASIIEEFCATTKQVNELVRVGLWHDHGHSCDQCPPVPEGGLVFHDWAALQPSRAEILAKRQAEAERKAEWRARRSRTRPGGSPEDVPMGQGADAMNAQVSEPSSEDVRDVSQRDTSVTDAGVPGVSRSTRPDPTRPVTTKEKTSSSLSIDAADAAPEPDPFDDFWAAYPRKTSKPAARTKWNAALKKTDPITIMRGLERYQFSPDPQFIPHPATWLHQERWADETSMRPNLVAVRPIQNEWEMPRGGRR